MNNTNTKKYKSLIVMLIVLSALIFYIYFINDKILNYKESVINDYNNFAALENEKNILEVYNKILLKGSRESIQIKRHILSNDRKQVLSLINELENYAKRVDIMDNNSLITSVSTREDILITKYNANDLVINIKVSGDEKKIDDFLNILNNLPVVSYIEKIDIKFDKTSNKNSANIVLIVYQKNEVK